MVAHPWIHFRIILYIRPPTSQAAAPVLAIDLEHRYPEVEMSAYHAEGRLDHLRRREVHIESVRMAEGAGPFGRSQEQAGV